ncbi:unnamed protein product [Chondrus crispus]|uniref:uridine/cytidine kinase n=1 Tax=Chondrus crispus TaxID=2769 RepID=R7QCX4_CHOCR|nr:unnamed protein product [Chondrus crispus]CDF35618.1 unnamed protein product [Chondrus crispus]|eukprot:XP_005715437.1 unnamed protein product [Chondrus crispus]
MLGPSGPPARAAKPTLPPSLPPLPPPVVTPSPSSPLPRASDAVLTAGCQHHTPPLKPLARLIDSRSQSPHPPHHAPVGPFIIGVTGGSASGKTTVCEKIIHGLGDQRCVLVSLDWFYHGLPDGVLPGTYNFDHPDAFDFEALGSTLESMKTRQPVTVPKYDFARHSRVEDNAADLDAADVIIVEGILTFYDPLIRNLMHMKIFVDEDADICLSRRITRDVKSRGRSVESILAQYTRFVKPAFERFILPTKRYADIVVPRGGDNLVAIDLIIKHIALKIRQEDLRKVFSNLVVMSDSYQSRGLHTISLGLLPFQRRTVTTPSGKKFCGVGFVQGLAGVSLMPNGETMESSLRDVCNTVRIGKMLMAEGGEKGVSYECLPEEIEDKYILVLDPVLDSGEACEMALARLMELGCREDRVLVLSLIVSPQAVTRICARFTKVQLVVSAIDKGIDADGRVYPGAGDFGTRYYGADTIWGGAR